MLSIKQRQQNLKILNFYKGAIDGIEGTNTKSAYKSFQQSAGIIVDGIYGINTNTKLVERIMFIQGKVGVNKDGIVGINTINAIKTYQKNNGLVVDSIVGVNTWNKMNNTSTPNLKMDDFKNFTYKEFMCKCGCGKQDIDLRLVDILQNYFRPHFGNKPIIITSGCRCANHNKKVGGVQGSRHTLSKACDFYIQGVSTSNLLSYAKQLVNQGVLRYTYTNSSNMNGVIHIDIN